MVVTKSTVPVGTGRRVANILGQRLPAGSFDVASNPEFLREGSAIQDFMRPDRVVIGTDSEHARTVLRSLYRPLYLIETPMVFTTIETAGDDQQGANAFLGDQGDVHHRGRRSVRGGRRRCSGRRPRHRARRPHRQQVSPCRPGVWRVVLPEGLAAPSSAPPRKPGRPCRSSRPCCASMTTASARWPTGSPRPAAASSPARRSPCSASPSSPIPTTCATAPACRSCRPSSRPAPRSAPMTPRAWTRLKS